MTKAADLAFLDRALEWFLFQFRFLFVIYIILPLSLVYNKCFAVCFFVLSN